MSGKNKLKPCPHCEKSVDFLGDDQCECPQDTMQMSRDLWNTRPVEDALQAEIDKLKAALMKLRWHADDHWFDEEALRIIDGALNHETS